MQGIEIPSADEPRSKTFAYLRSKLEAIANSPGGALDAYDLDLFLIRGPMRFWDDYLDSPPSVESVRALVEAGVPRWALVNRGIVNEVEALLAARRERRLATLRRARYLRDRGHPRSWSVRAQDVSAELRRLKEGRGLC
jgi:hypothetical protein